MKNMKKIIAVLMSLTAITMTTSAFAAEGKGTAEYDAETKAVTLDAKEDLASATGQLTVVILPVNAGKEGYESITSGNIYYINQAEAGDGVGKFNDIIKAMKVKTVTDENGDEVEFAATNYEVRIGGALPNDYYVYTITVEKDGEDIVYKVGDTDGDDRFTTADATAIYNYILTGSKFNKTADSSVLPKNVGDTDVDSRITTADATSIYQKILGTGNFASETYTLPAGTTADSTY